MLSKLSVLKERFFPIHKNESIKFILLSSICFLVCMNYTILRNLKETLIITNPDLGIYVVPFLRTWVLAPIMLLSVKAYAIFSSRFPQPKVFYLLISFFLLYFLLYVYLLLPYEEVLRLDWVANWLSPIYKPFTKPIAEIIRFWIHSLYYCLSEIWGSMVVLILFWGTSNRLTTMEQAKRFYAPMIFITNFSGIISSQVSISVSSSSIKWLFFSTLDKWQATLSTLTLFVCIATLLVMFLFYCLHRICIPTSVVPTFSKEEMTLAKMIDTIRKNRKFWSLAIMVAAYFFSTGILELIWKHYLFKIYSDANRFNDFLNQTTSYIGIFSTLIAFFITGDLIRRFEWKISALITPALLLIPLVLMLINSFFGVNDPLFLKIGTIGGAIYYCVNRICKFTFFDLSKEIASIEFSYSEQIKAKAVLDGLLPKMAKMSESLFLQFMLILFSSFGSIIVPVLLFMLGIHLIWAFSFSPRKKFGILKETSL